ARRRDQRVRRLEVAMHDEVAVRVTERVADLEEQSQARAHVQPARVTVVRDPLALDILHREERTAVIGDTAIEQPRDVRVFEPRQDLPLAQEPPDRLARVGPAPDQLERVPLLELTVIAVRRSEEHTSELQSRENL